MTSVLNIWIALLAWVIIYLTDYYVTIYSARVYRPGDDNDVRFEGSFELMPQFQKNFKSNEECDRTRIYSLCSSKSSYWHFR